MKGCQGEATNDPRAFLQFAVATLSSVADSGCRQWLQTGRVGGTAGKEEVILMRILLYFILC
jgi:hypothetical protein